jgi:hypothetical protein
MGGSATSNAYIYATKQNEHYLSLAAGMTGEMG